MHRFVQRPLKLVRCLQYKIQLFPVNVKMAVHIAVVPFPGQDLNPVLQFVDRHLLDVEVDSNESPQLLFLHGSATYGSKS